jgi:hypothetical protein
MRILAYVATGMSVVMPLVHRIDIFGLDLMNNRRRFRMARNDRSHQMLILMTKQTKHIT